MRPVLGYTTLYSRRIIGLKKKIPAYLLQYEPHNISISPCILTNTHKRRECEARNIFQKDRWHNLEIDYFSMIKTNAIKVINVQANMSGGSLLDKQGHTCYQSQITLNLRSRSKASAYSYAKKFQLFPKQALVFTCL